MDWNRGKQANVAVVYLVDALPLLGRGRREGGCEESEVVNERQHAVHGVVSLACLPEDHRTEGHHQRQPCTHAIKNISHKPPSRATQRGVVVSCGVSAPSSSQASTSDSLPLAWLRVR
jgi:hypothetical protein